MTFENNNWQNFIECWYLQMGYNLLWRSVEYDVQPICAKNNISILAYSPLQQGLLTGKFEKLEDVPEGRRRGKLFSNVG